MNPASVQRSRGSCAQDMVKSVCVVFQIPARRGSWRESRPGQRRCGSTRCCGRGQSVLPVSLCPASAPSSQLCSDSLLQCEDCRRGQGAVLAGTRGRLPGLAGAPPTVPQQRRFLLSFSAQSRRLRGDHHSPGYCLTSNVSCRRHHLCLRLVSY